MRALVFCGLVLSSGAAGAFEFDAYDFEHCKRWNISDQVGGHSLAYQEALRLEKAQPNSRSAALAIRRSDTFGTTELEQLALVLSASTFANGNQNKFIEKFGVCTYKAYQKPAEFSCLPGQEFPFSGATYRGVIRKNDVLWMKCASRCDRVRPSMIAVTLDVNEEGADETKERRALRKDFQRRCKRDR